MEIRSLSLRARAVVEGFMSGLHRSPRTGFSTEFTEYRQYSPGDDVRFLDWKVMARTDREFIKKFEDETNLRCTFLVDFSRSMEFGGDDAGVKKSDYARTFAASLAWFLTQQRDAVGLATFDRDVREFIPPRYRQDQLKTILGRLETQPAGNATDLCQSLEKLASLVGKRGMVVLVSDFLSPLHELERCLSLFTAAGHDVRAVQVLHPREVDFDYDSAAIFEDMESGQNLILDPGMAREAYRRKITAHNDALDAMFSAQGVPGFRVTTAEPLERVLRRFLEERPARAVVRQRRSNGRTAA
ncbi:MAG: DUF58 domain-containing protein [Verrucomicrobiota bacterium]|nr:DUF58 domain-containing protein [Verrucomicrobiota bacterium]